MVRSRMRRKKEEKEEEEERKRRKKRMRRKTRETRRWKNRRKGPRRKRKVSKGQTEDSHVLPCSLNVLCSQGVAGLLAVLGSKLTVGSFGVLQLISMG